MYSTYPVLHICASAELCCTCENEALFACTELLIHFSSCLVGLRVTGEAYLLTGNTALDKFLLYRFIYREMPVIVVYRNIAENDLNALFRHSIIVILFEIVDKHHYLAVGSRLHFRIYTSAVQSEQTRFVRNA